MNGAEVKVYSKSKDGERKLSTNFKVKEFACKDGSDVIFVSDSLVQVLQAIRLRFGKPVIINSGYRTLSHNRSVGGATYSQHIYGLAADLSIYGVEPDKVAEYADTMLKNTGGIGIYNWGVHIDVRKEKTRWRG